MKKFLLFIILAAAVIVSYVNLKDPQKRENVMGAIEGSTGVDLSSEPKDLIEDAGRVVGDAAENALRDLGNTLKDPAFHRSLERWGKEALNKLDSDDLNRLKGELEREAGGGGDYDAILEKYLKGTDNS